MRYKLLFFIITSFFLTAAAFAKNHSASIANAVETASASHCYFVPPPQWEIADPSTLSPKVKIAFLKTSNKGFCPSINLAIEETDVSLSEYLKAVKTIHEQDRKNQWRALGKVRTAAGMAQLTEIDSTTEWGPVRILQLILIKDKYAYVVTAAALKEEMSNYYKEVQAAFRSLTISHDLLQNIPQQERRDMLKDQQTVLFAAASSEKSFFEDPVFLEKNLIPFQKMVIDNFTDMGAFWQILVLRNVHDKLHTIHETNQVGPL
jgi:hypothetical protein